MWFIPVIMSTYVTLCTADVHGHKQRKSELFGGVKSEFTKILKPLYFGLGGELYHIPHLNSKELYLTDGTT